MVKSAVTKIALALAAVSGFTSNAHADASTELYHCSFNTGHLSISYNTDAEELYTVSHTDIIEQANGSYAEVPRIKDQVKLKTVGTSGNVNLVDNQGTVLYRLELTGKGNDGSSDAVYPFDGYVENSGESYRGHMGGCYSTSHPMLAAP